MIYVAIDTPVLADVYKLIINLPKTVGVKIGLETFLAYGRDAVLPATAFNRNLFLDLKYHDIPNTVAGAVRSAIQMFSPNFLTVHCAGGEEMMKAASYAARRTPTKVLGVTVLTSLQADPEEIVDLAKKAYNSGLHGVVCSAHEIEAIRQAIPDKDFVLMVPGIRPEGYPAGDQQRVATPLEAMRLGATHLVIGRPITQAPDPIAAANAILESLNE